MKPGCSCAESEAAYLAGFFDADGSISITPPRSTSLYLLTIMVTQVVREPLEMFKARFGGKIGGPWQVTERTRPISRWSCETHVAATALEMMSPYLVVKRERAQLALEFRELFKGENILPRGPHVARFPEKRERVLRMRHDCYVRMRTLNKRGIS